MKHTVESNRTQWQTLKNKKTKAETKSQTYSKPMPKAFHFGNLVNQHFFFQSSKSRAKLGATANRNSVKTEPPASTGCRPRLFTLGYFWLFFLFLFDFFFRSTQLHRSLAFLLLLFFATICLFINHAASTLVLGSLIFLDSALPWKMFSFFFWICWEDTS